MRWARRGGPAGAALSLILWVVGLTYYAVCVVGTLLLSFVLPPRAFDPALKAAMRGVFRLIFVEVQVEGREQVEDGGPFVFFPSPHCSLLDVPLMAGFLPGVVRGVYAAGQDRWPLYGWVMRRLGNIPIQRGDVHAAITAMNQASRVFDLGASLVIFPEGHRTTTGQALPFKKLPFHFAGEAARPVVPVALEGMFAVNNKTSWRLRPGTVVVRIGKPVPGEKVASMSALELRELVETRIARLQSQGRPR